MRARPLLLLLVAAGAVWSCTGSGGNKPITPPDTAAPPDYSEQKFASEAMSEGGLNQSLLYSISNVIALGTTSVSTAFAPRTMWVPTTGPTGTPPPDPTPIDLPPHGVNDYADPDSDGIPNNTLLGMTNQTIATVLGVSGLNGYVLTSDLSPNLANGDYQGLAHLEITPSTALPWGWSAAGATFDTQYRSLPSAGVPGSGLDLDSTSADRIVFTSGTAQHVCVSETQYSLVYVPTGVYTAGRSLVDGTFSISGSAMVTIDGTTWPVNVQTTTALTISPSCNPSLVTAGRIDLTFGTSGSAGTMSAHWSGCGVMSVDTPAPSPTATP